MNKSRGCRFIILRGLMWIGIVLVALVLLGVGYQTISTQMYIRSGQPRGQLYTVNSHQMHLVCAGEGIPTVILLAGGGADSLWWHRIQRQLAAHTRVCAYDRPSHGWSEPTSEPRDALTIVSELRALLQTAGVQAPYVMAGHSFGALWARIYAAQYPDEVVGVVLVDSTFLIPSEYDNQSEFDAWKRANDALKVLEWIAYRTGLVRLTAPGDFQKSGYPQEIVGDLTALRSPNRVFDADYAEQIATRKEFTQASAAAENLGDLPLAVLWASESATAQDFFRAQRDQIATFSTNSSTRVIEGADHGAILGNERYAQQVSNAILAVMKAAQTGERLSQLLQ